MLQIVKRADAARGASSPGGCVIGHLDPVVGRVPLFQVGYVIGMVGPAVIRIPRRVVLGIFGIGGGVRVGHGPLQKDVVQLIGQGVGLAVGQLAGGILGPVREKILVVYSCGVVGKVHRRGVGGVFAPVVVDPVQGADYIQLGHAVPEGGGGRVVDVVVPYGGVVGIVVDKVFRHVVADQTPDVLPLGHHQLANGAVIPVQQRYDRHIAQKVLGIHKAPLGGDGEVDVGPLAQGIGGIHQVVEDQVGQVGVFPRRSGGQVRVHRQDGDGVVGGVGLVESIAGPLVLLGDGGGQQGHVGVVVLHLVDLVLPVDGLDLGPSLVVEGHARVVEPGGAGQVHVLIVGKADHLLHCGGGGGRSGGPTAGDGSPAAGGGGKVGHLFLKLGNVVHLVAVVADHVDVLAQGVLAVLGNGDVLHLLLVDLKADDGNCSHFRKVDLFVIRADGAAGLDAEHGTAVVGHAGGDSGNGGIGPTGVGGTVADLGHLLGGELLGEVAVPMNGVGVRVGGAVGPVDAQDQLVALQGPVHGSEEVGVVFQGDLQGLERLGVAVLVHRGLDPKAQLHVAGEEAELVPDKVALDLHIGEIGAVADALGVVDAGHGVVGLKGPNGQTEGPGGRAQVQEPGDAHARGQRKGHHPAGHAVQEAGDMYFSVEL